MSNNNKRDFQKDLYGIRMLLKEDLYHMQFQYERVYRNTNEDLKSIMKHFNFKGKDVLSVMGSADQVLSFYYLGASNVDSFDKNVTTFYYYYLKKWFISLYKSCVVSYGSDKLLPTIDKANLKVYDERIAYYVFKELLKEFPSLYKMFIVNKLYKWSVPFKDDIDRLIKTMFDKEANFRELDLYSEFDIDKRYDIIYLSNILDYDQIDLKNYIIVANNIRGLLKDDGVAICTTLNLDYDRVIGNNRSLARNFDIKLSNEKVLHRTKKIVMPLYYTCTKK